MSIISFDVLLKEGTKLSSSSREDPKPSTIMMIGLS